MPYRCPTCGLSDPDAYIGCNYAMCPDGRDQRRLDPPHWRDPPRPVVHRDGNSPWTLLWVAAITAALLTGAFYLAGMLHGL